MKHKGFTTRAELLRAAADSIEMQGNVGINPKCKFESSVMPIFHFAFQGEFDKYEFPLAVVEGKPVWEGDELYDEFNRKVIITEYSVEDDMLKGDGRWFSTEKYSWNPPKPKTVMVELRRDTALLFASWDEHEHPRYNVPDLIRGCRKALEETK